MPRFPSPEPVIIENTETAVVHPDGVEKRNFTAQEKADRAPEYAAAQAAKAARDAERDRKKALKDDNDAKHARTIASGGTGAIRSHVNSADDAELRKLITGLLMELGAR